MFHHFSIIMALCTLATSSRPFRSSIYVFQTETNIPFSSLSVAPPFSPTLSLCRTIESWAKICSGVCVFTVPILIDRLQTSQHAQATSSAKRLNEKNEEKGWKCRVLQGRMLRDRSLERNQCFWYNKQSTTLLHYTSFFFPLQLLHSIISPGANLSSI